MTTNHPIISIQSGYLNFFREGNFLPAISIMASAKGSMNPFTKPAKSNSSLGFPNKTKSEVEIIINTIKAVCVIL